MRRLFSMVLLCMVAFAAQAEVLIHSVDSGTNARLRGISASYDVGFAWASGEHGTVLRTTDGEHWEKRVVPGAQELYFRSIRGHGPYSATVMASGPGEASRVYQTNDEGRTWDLVLQNRDPRGFFNCMIFNGQRGYVLGDPIDGRFQIWRSDDFGRNWQPLTDAPAAVEGEVAFAASSSCVARWHGGIAIGTGGTVSRIHVLDDGKPGWRVIDSGMGRGLASAGVFSLAELNLDIIAVGGDYNQETKPGNAVVWANPALKVLPAPRGFRSAVTCPGGKLPCIAVGPSGVDSWDGERWSVLSNVGYDAIDMVRDDAGWLSGPNGRTARISIIRVSIRAP